MHEENDPEQPLAPMAVSIATAARLLECSKPTVYRYIRDDPAFPKPFRLVAGGASRLNYQALLNWVRLRENGRPLASQGGGRGAPRR